MKMAKAVITQKKRLPVKLVYYEEFDRIDQAFYREQQVKGWNRKKKEALIKEQLNTLPDLSKNYQDISKISGIDRSCP